MISGTEIVAPINWLGRCLCASVGRQYNLLRNLDENMKTLKRKMEVLSAKADDIKIQLHRAEVQQGMKLKNEVQVWLDQMESLKSEVECVERELEEKRGCLIGCFSYYYSRLKVANKVTRKIEKAVEFYQMCQFSDGLFIDKVLDTRKTLPTTALVGKTTAERTLEMIWNCLMDTEIQKIGVYGMGGVGKTTIMKHINNRLTETHPFDPVIWVTVSKSKSLYRLQTDIAKAAEINPLEDDDEETRSIKLHAALIRLKKFLLILDDVWEAFPLEAVGIPEPNKENNCKVILTTRDRRVCRQMETQKYIQVEVLSKEEAWDLFKDKVGGDLVVSSKLEEIAKLVVEECGGLPLAIITVGRALRQVNDLRVWRNALNELKGSTTEIQSMDVDVYGRLKFSYIHLRNDELRACFLYCALYPEDYEIPTIELVKYWIYEGLINERENREKDIDKGYTILHELKEACLLESLINRYDIECVKMHDLIRGMAINITRVSPCFMVKAGVGLNELPMVEWKEDVERISLMNNNIRVLSGEPKCPKLCTLLLQQNHQLKNISPSFFEHMHSLRVLDLSHTRIKCLPPSLSNLENLHALLLHSCYDLKMVPQLAKLKSLRVLDVYYTGIEALPQGMEELVNLRHLNLSRTFCLNIFPIGVICNLSLLEDLFMYQSKYRWSWDSLQVEGGAIIEDITKSTHLTNLHVHFVDWLSFDSYVRSGHWQVLKSFHFLVGQVSDLLPRDTSQRNYIVEIGGCYLANCEKSLVLPSKTLLLAIEDCNDIFGLSELQFLLQLNDLKECHISRCSAIEYIVMPEKNTLSTIEALELWKLPKLRSICKAVGQYDPLKCLRILKVDGCHGLKNLFSIELLHHLQNIEEIRVEKCMMMESIVGVEENVQASNNVVTLPRLRSLELEHLPNLKSVYSGRCVCRFLQTIYVKKCPKLKKLPLFVDGPPSTLKNITGSRNWWDMLEWNDSNNKILLEVIFKEEEEEDDDDDDDDDEIHSL